MEHGSTYGPNKTVGSELVNSLSRGLLVLECFTLEEPRLTQSNIQKLSKIPKSTLFRLLKTLTGLNYLKCDPESRRYFLGPKVLTLGFSVLQNLEVRGIARAYLDSLSREFNRGVSLLMLDKDEMVFVERIRVPILRDFNIGIGSRIPVYNTAAGRAVLAHLSRERVVQIVKDIKKDGRTASCIGKKGEKLFEILAEVRKQGYAINDEESIKGVRAIAVPIFSAEGIAYAMNLVVPPEEITVEELRRKYAPRLIEVGREISEAMGYQDRSKGSRDLREKEISAVNRKLPMKARKAKARRSYVDIR